MVMGLIGSVLGYGLIVSGVIAWLVNNSFAIDFLKWFWPPLGSAVVYYATNLELIIPIGLFLVISDPSPKKLAIGAGAAAIAAVALWLMGF